MTFAIIPQNIQDNARFLQIARECGIRTGDFPTKAVAGYWQSELAKVSGIRTRVITVAE